MASRIGVDTNVIVSFLTDRSPAQQARAAELFTAATAGDVCLVLHQLVISEVVYVLGNLYQQKPTHIRAILRDLLASPGVVTIDQIRWPSVLALWPRRITDFGDACLAAVAEAGAFDALATFDAAFRRRLRRRGIATYW